MVDRSIGLGFPPGHLRVLVVDDEPDVRLGLQMLADSIGAEARTAASGEEALAIFTEWPAHVVLSDITMGKMSGIDLLARVRERSPETRVVLITGFGTIELAVDAMHRGAAHFLTKPFDNEEILDVVRKFGQQALVAERLAACREEGETGPVPSLVHASPGMERVLGLVEQVAPTRMTVLVEGESGTGKELVARAIHSRSTAAKKPFLAVNTAALPDNLLESELFGHAKGAFTGAIRERKGIFELAEGGTVFLDEVGLMSPAFQGKLLRVLQERTVVPLGTSRSVAVDFRLVAATSRSLEETEEFRSDLYYRLAVVKIEVPPLRERKGDVIPLALHFLAKYAHQVEGLTKQPPSLNAAALEALATHHWPGNVRELENTVQRALVLSGGGEIRPGHLGIGKEDSEASKDDLTYEDAKQRAVENFQRRYVTEALRRTGGNVSQAARECGLTRAALQRILKNLDLNRERFAE